MLDALKKLNLVFNNIKSYNMFTTKIFSFFTFMLLVLTILSQSCGKMNEPMPLDIISLNPVVGSSAYYEALREYKKSDHPVSFVWWGTSGTTSIGTDMANRYEGLPDSLDIVSLWGSFPVLGSPVWEEMQEVRRKKGTKFLMCLFGSGVEHLMIRNDSALFVDDVMAAIDNVAKAISDTINKYQIDGFDLDYEPDYGDRSIFGDENSNRFVTNDPHTQRLFQSLSNYMGPESGTEKLLIIDGQFDIGIERYVDYLMQQAYGSTTAAQLQGRFNNFGGGVLPSTKFVPTEDMQGNGPAGVNFMYNGENVRSLAGMALWNPTQGRKGGFGAYLLEYDAISNAAAGYYYNFRRCIQLQNPAAR